METTRCESTNVGAIDTGLIEKEISVTTKKESETYHKWITMVSQTSRSI